MFLFRKKTKILPPTIVRRKKATFPKKSAPLREAALLQQSDDAKESRGGFYFVYMFLWVAFVGVTVYVLIFSSFLRLNTIRIDGTVDVPEQNIEQLIRSDMSKKYFGIFPKDNLLLFPRATVEADIKDHFKKVRAVEVVRAFPHMLTVHIQERKTLVLWCVDETCFYIDEDGYAYAPVDSSQSSEVMGGFLKIMDTSAQNVDTNEPVIDPDFVRFAADIQERLRQESGIEIDAQCTTPSRFSDELILKTQEGWAIDINVRLPLDKSLRTLELLLKKEISPERRQHLKYIDLRTENRVYYSVEGETVSAPEPLDASLKPPTIPTLPATEDKVVNKDKKK
jgi:cell division septal protein FtsQ